MKKKRNWVIAIVLSVTAGAVALLNRGADATVDVVVGPAYEGCAYIWAYHDAPDLTQKVNSAVQALDPAATANVNLYGEDCVYADGRSTFGAMETDFYVHLAIDDLSKDENFGNWIAKVMPLIVGIPREKIQGNYGFVEFWFEKTDTEKLVVRVPIQKYIDEAQGKTGLELIDMFIETP